MSWYGLRDYGCFDVTFTVETRDRIETGIDDYHYSEPYREERTMRIVAPSEAMAIAYMQDKNTTTKPEVVMVVKSKIDGVVLAMGN